MIDNDWEGSPLDLDTWSLFNFIISHWNRSQPASLHKKKGSVEYRIQIHQL